MKRNRKIKQHSRFTSNVGRVAVLIALAIAGMLIYVYQDGRCSALEKDIGDAKRRLRALDNELVRETRRFNGMTTRENLDVALNRFGLKMDYPSGRQLIKMGADGRPLPGQHSVTLAQKRAAGASSANVKVVKNERPAAKPTRTQKVRR